MMWFWLKWTLSPISPRASFWSWDDLVGRGVSRTLSKWGWVISPKNLTKKKGNLNRTQEHNGGGEYSSLIKILCTIEILCHIGRTRDDCACRLAEFPLMPFFLLARYSMFYFLIVCHLCYREIPDRVWFCLSSPIHRHCSHLELIMMRLSGFHGDPHLSSPVV